MTDATASPDSLTSVTRAQGVPVIGCWADAPLQPVQLLLVPPPPDAADLCVISTPAKSKLEKNQSGTVRREQRAAKAFPSPGVSYVTSLLHLSLLFAPKQLQCNRGLRSIIVQTDIPDV